MVLEAVTRTPVVDLIICLLRLFLAGKVLALGTQQGGLGASLRLVLRRIIDGGGDGHAWQRFIPRRAGGTVGIFVLLDVGVLAVGSVSVAVGAVIWPGRGQVLLRLDKGTAT